MGVLSLKNGSAYARYRVLRAYVRRRLRWTRNTQQDHHQMDVCWSFPWSNALHMSIKVPPLRYYVIWGWALYETRTQKLRPKNWFSKKILTLQIYNNSYILYTLIVQLIKVLRFMWFPWNRFSFCDIICHSLKIYWSKKA